jgi:hypothetical protein
MSWLAQKPRDSDEFGTRHQRFDFRRDLRFADEPKRSIVQQELATEPLSTRTLLDLISPNLFGIERQTHDFSE